MTREKINLNSTMTDLYVQLCEGNPGGLTVIIEIIKNHPDGPFILLHADDMNIRGSQLWVAYKHWADNDINKLCEGIMNRSQELVDVVNKECPEHVAVKGGASFNRPKQPNSERGK